MNKLKSRNVPPYKLAVSGVQVDGEEAVPEVWGRGQADGIYLDKVKNNLTVFFSALTYTHPSDMFYEYRLEGGEDDVWKPLIGKSSVSFYNLFAGDYLLRIRSIGFPESEIVLPVKVHSVFWSWFVAGAGLLFIGSLAWFLVRKKRSGRLHVSGRQESQDNPVTQPDPDKLVLQTILDGALETYIPPMEHSEDESAKEKYKVHKVDPEECRQLQKILERLMQEEKPYKNSELKIADLAKMTGYTSHTLSYAEW